MSPEALRAMFYAIGSTMVLVGGFDDTLVAAGIPALGLLSPAISKAILGLGMLAIGYAKTGRLVGDFALKDVSAALRDTVAPAKPAEPKT
jgi:hypothetical protein